MEDIITQRFSFATIKTFKNYSKLVDKKKSQRFIEDNLPLLIDDEDEEDDLFPEFKVFSVNPTIKPIGKLYSLPNKKTKPGSVFYFTTNEEITERFNLTPTNKTSEWFTSKEHQIKRHYGNPFSEITIEIIERSIRKHGDKVTIKIYHSTRTRGFNCLHFKKNYNVSSITVNLKNGNFWIGKIFKSGKNKKTLFRCNSFLDLSDILRKNINPFRVSSSIPFTSVEYDNFEKIFDDKSFSSKVHEVLGIVDGNENYSRDPLMFFGDFVTSFHNKKQIKMPNGDFRYWLTRLYPTEKYLKKNDRKLVASILDMLGLKSKVTIKIFHTYPSIDLFSFVSLCRYFGSNYNKYIGNVNNEVFINSCLDLNLKSETHRHFKHDLETNKQYISKLNDTEKENLVKIVNSLQNSNERRRKLSLLFIQELDDHFNMINKIREIDPTVYMRARDINEFEVEHRELSKTISVIRKGWTVEYQYDQKTLEQLEKPLECLYDDYTIHHLYPTILKREEDYIEEGQHMHHCVASYSNKDKSIIISVRTENGHDRVTCEFDIQTGRCLQKRSFCNAQPPKHFENGLDIMEGIVLKLARFGILNWKEKKRVPVKINGIEISKELLPINATELFGVELPFM